MPVVNDNFFVFLHDMHGLTNDSLFSKFCALACRVLGSGAKLHAIAAALMTPKKQVGLKFTTLVASYVVVISKNVVADKTRSRRAISTSCLWL